MSPLMTDVTDVVLMNSSHAQLIADETDEMSVQNSKFFLKLRPIIKKQCMLSIHRALLQMIADSSDKSCSSTRAKGMMRFSINAKGSNSLLVSH